MNQRAKSHIDKSCCHTHSLPIALLGPLNWSLSMPTAVAVSK